MNENDGNEKKESFEKHRLDAEQKRKDDNLEANREKRREAFKKAREEAEKNRKDYLAMTPFERIKANLEGIQKELEDRGIRTDCSNHKVYCIDCAISEVLNNLQSLQEKPKD